MIDHLAVYLPVAAFLVTSLSVVALFNLAVSGA